jgi:hypothetical protein
MMPTTAGARAGAATTSTRSLSPGFLMSPGFLRSPAFLRSASSLGTTRSESPFVRLGSTKSQPREEVVVEEEGEENEAAGGIELEDIRSEADAHSCRPSFVSPRSTDYCCAICIELLLRPVVLSCGHRMLPQGFEPQTIADRGQVRGSTPQSRLLLTRLSLAVDRPLPRLLGACAAGQPGACRRQPHPRQRRLPARPLRGQGERARGRPGSRERDAITARLQAAR